MAAILASPALCLVILGGIAAEKTTHPKREDASPYHARAKAALDNWPVKIGEDWTSHDLPVQDAAVRLLHPNAIVSRSYINVKEPRKSANLLIVQCSEPDDMSGHYPPNCYPSSGQELAQPPLRRTWQMGDLQVTGMEYHFEGRNLGAPDRVCVYNFFILPGRGIVADMKDVDKATGDYVRRYFGAAEFQMVFPGEMSQETRDEIFMAIVGSNVQVLKVLNPPGI